ncbi:MAG: DUF2164 domain-containing protein [Bacillota bacterium]|nr:DUF2164 domain-containing protein [Bacillota bacterium]
MYLKSKDAKNIELSDDRKKRIIEDIKEYFYKERGEEIGILAAELFYNFIIERIGAEIYNQGLIDAKKFLEEKADDIYGMMK